MFILYIEPGTRGATEPRIWPLRLSAVMRRLCWSAVAGALLLTRPVAAQVASGTEDALRLERMCESLAPGTPHVDALHKVCQYAVSIPRRMPNFTCSQKTTRRVTGREDADVVTATVTYEDGSETYQNVRMDGHPVDASRMPRAGTWSTGQFAGDLRSIFDTSNPVSFQFVKENTVSGRRILIFEYRVERQNLPLWVLEAGGQSVAPPYHGQLWIDEDTGALVQLQVIAADLPQDFPMRSASLQIDYQDVAFGDGTSFVLATKSVVDTSNRDGSSNRNMLEFSQCHKFAASAHIMPQ